MGQIPDGNLAGLVTPTQLPNRKFHSLTLVAKIRSLFNVVPGGQQVCRVKNSRFDLRVRN